MLITFVRECPRPQTPPRHETAPQLTIGVCEDRAEEVTSALAKDGWHLVSKIYAPSAPVIDSLQVALLEVNTLPLDAPIRVAVELGALAAILSSPLWLDPKSSDDLVSSLRVH